MSAYFKTENGRLYHGDCMEHFEKISNGVVDMILCDLPYGTTNCEWDTKIPLAPLWEQWGRILKDNGIVCLTAQQPFVTELINSVKRPFKFRYELIWEKTKACGFLNANRMPLRAHENILIFYRKMPRYVPQLSEGRPYKASKGKGTSLYGRRWCTGSSNAFYSPTPFDVIPITRCLECDKNFMMKWIQKRLNRNWKIDKIKAACEE